MKAVEPSESKEERQERVLAHIRAFNKKIAELEKQGYWSGGYDFDTDRTAIVKGEYPNGKIVGYLNRDLSITWR